jgi:hypothetical protein
MIVMHYAKNFFRAIACQSDEHSLVFATPPLQLSRSAISSAKKSLLKVLTEG